MPKALTTPVLDPAKSDQCKGSDSDVEERKEAFALLREDSKEAFAAKMPCSAAALLQAALLLHACLVATGEQRGGRKGNRRQCGGCGGGGYSPPPPAPPPPSTACSAGQYLSQACSSGVDRVCTLCSATQPASCADDQYRQGCGSGTSGSQVSLYCALSREPECAADILALLMPTGVVPSVRKLRDRAVSQRVSRPIGWDMCRLLAWHVRIGSRLPNRLRHVRLMSHREIHSHGVCSRC